MLQLAKKSVFYISFHYMVYHCFTHSILAWLRYEDDTNLNIFTITVVNHNNIKLPNVLGITWYQSSVAMTVNECLLVYNQRGALELYYPHPIIMQIYSMAINLFTCHFTCFTNFTGAQSQRNTIWVDVSCVCTVEY